jgi:predicted small metal-binding protein
MKYSIIININYMKILACKDMGVDCPWVGKAETTEELLMMAKEHAMKDHKEYWDNTMSKMSDEEMRAMAEKFIKEE